jgi:hypothetical protein
MRRDEPEELEELPELPEVPTYNLGGLNIPQEVSPRVDPDSPRWQNGGGAGGFGAQKPKKPLFGGGKKAPPKPPPKKKRKKGGVSSTMLFWVGFVIFVLLLFIINGPHIRETMESTHLLDRLTGQPDSQTTPPPQPSPAEGEGATANIPPRAGGTEGGVTIEGEPTPPPQPSPPQGEGETANSPPLAGGTEGGVSSAPANLRARSLYFVNIDAAGSIDTVKTTRMLPASGTPLIDTLRALFTGPTAEEKKRGATSLIPAGTRVLSATVKDGVANINLSEDFMFNSYGAEAYYASLRQLVMTATEFSSVQKVQILIEGRKVRFLAENIPIGAPLGRDSL